MFSGITNIYPQIPQDIWIAVFAQLDQQALNIVHQVCQLFNRLADHKIVQDSLSRHPYDKFARFYVKSMDANEILKRFRALDIDHQNYIKATLWEEGGRKTIPFGDWAEVQLQHHLFEQHAAKTILAFGKLGYRLSELSIFKCYVANINTTSEQVVDSLKRLTHVSLLATFGNLKPQTLFETIKFNIWSLSGGQDLGDVDFGFNFIRRNPHDPLVKEAI